MTTAHGHPTAAELIWSFVDVTGRYRSGELFGFEAGGELAQAGRRVFPLPKGQKHDHGAGAWTDADASNDPEVWVDQARDTMARHSCDDVGDAYLPGGPVTGLDIDGPKAVARFDETASGDGHLELVLGRDRETDTRGQWQADGTRPACW